MTTIARSAMTVLMLAVLASGVRADEPNIVATVGGTPITKTQLENHVRPQLIAIDAERYEALMGPGGISDCGKAMNCVAVCPKAIPLMESIADMNRQITRHLLVDWLKD